MVGVTLEILKVGQICISRPIQKMLPSVASKPYSFAIIATLVAMGDLGPAEESYSTAVKLCRENLEGTEKGLGIRRCDDLSILLLNRGSLRLNNGMPKEALEDLESASVLRGRPDAIILQNLARAREVNGYYSQSDRDYNLAISMTANEVNPFWLRSALVKLQLGDVQGGFDILKRVENR